MAYTIAWHAQGAIIAYSGRVALEDLMAATQALYTDPRYSDCRFQIADFSLADFSHISLDHIQAIAASDAAASQMLPNIPSAIVTQHPIGEALAFHYRMIAEAHQVKWDIQLFPVLREALRWRDKVLAAVIG